MSYFDHVRCQSCKAMLDPEALAPGMACPRCGGKLSLPDLFGVGAAFEEEEPEAVSLDDLVPPPPPRRPAAPAGGASSSGGAASSGGGAGALEAMRALKRKK